ncbi:hypothetical protein LCGC14_2469470, partial [marine sediment metagenome]
MGTGLDLDRKDSISKKQSNGGEVCVTGGYDEENHYL